MGLFAKLKEGLTKTRDKVTKALGGLFASKGEVDDDFYDEMEELLITGDVSVDTAMRITEGIRKRVRKEHITERSAVKQLLMDEVRTILDEGTEPLELTSPSVMLIVGVNGVGKTTAIGKLAGKYSAEGKKVLLAAGDTFRAAATEQLQIWGERAGVPVVSGREGADPGSVLFDAAKESKTSGADLLICDTAGRLHNKVNLMNELGKMGHILDRELPDAHRECFLVLDATTGQNAIVQAKAFKDMVGITGIILTKLDGTAKGGVVIAIKDELKVPIRFIGVGEQLEDLQEFSSADFVKALFDEGE